MLAAYTPSSQEPPRPAHVGEWLTVCDTDSKRCSDNLFDMIWDHTNGPQTVGFCLPNGVGEDVITGKVVAWLKARPALAGTDTDTGMIRALEASYPCR
jgi:hypothetical protein